MTKSSSKKSSRAERREERRSSSSNSPYKMRSAASRRAEARARADYRDGGSTAVVDGQPIASKDVGVRVNPNASARVKKKVDTLTDDYVSRLLHHPTRNVSEETMQAEYGYVVHDIRSMFILAAGLFALLIVLAFIVPR